MTHRACPRRPQQRRTWDKATDPSSWPAWDQQGWAETQGRGGGRGGGTSPAGSINPQLSSLIKNWRMITTVAVKIGRCQQARLCCAPSLLSRGGLGLCQALLLRYRFALTQALVRIPDTALCMMPFTHLIDLKIRSLMVFISYTLRQELRNSTTFRETFRQ